MRWTGPKHGDIRVVRRFLWVPLRIGSKWRWFERAHIKQEWDNNFHNWYNVMFVDDAEAA